MVVSEQVARACGAHCPSSGRLPNAKPAAAAARLPTALLPTVCYLCQGLIAPEFAGVELGVAEKLAARAVATAAGVGVEQVRASLRETGDLGQAAEQLLATTAAERPPSLQVAVVVDTLRQIAAAEGQGSQARKLELLGWLLQQATPLEARYLLGLVAATLVKGGLAAVEQLQVRPGNPVRPMLAQRLSSAAEILAKLGACAAEYKYDGIRVQAHRTTDGSVELYTRRLDRVPTQFPEVVKLLDQSLPPREAILEGEVVAFDPASGELRPFQEAMFRRRKYGITEAVSDYPVSMFCFELLYADGTDLTRLPHLERRAALAGAISPSPRLRLATAEQVSDEAGLERVFEQAVAEGCEGVICKSVNSTDHYQAGARGWQWIKLKRDYRTELSDTLDLVVVGGLAGRGRRAGMYGALLLGVYDAAADRFQTICKCGTGFSDAELAALPARLAPLARAERPAGWIRAGPLMCGSSPPWWWRCSPPS